MENTFLKQDKEATAALLYLVNKLGSKGIPIAESEWNILQRHIEMVNNAIFDRDLKFKVGEKIFSVSLSWLKFAHHVLAAAANYYGDARQEIQQKGGTS